MKDSDIEERVKKIALEAAVMEAAVGGGIKRGLEDFFKPLMFHIFIAIIILTAWSWFIGAYDKDSTDSEDKRSGMSLHVDNLTGCEYLSTAQGGIHPRLSADGETHRGCKKLKDHVSRISY